MKEITMILKGLEIKATKFSDEIFHTFFNKTIEESDIDNCIINYCICNPKKVNDLKKLFNALMESIFNKAVEDGVDVIDEDYIMQFNDDPVANAIGDAFGNALDEIAVESGYTAICDRKEV